MSQTGLVIVVTDRIGIGIGIVSVFGIGIVSVFGIGIVSVFGKAIVDVEINTKSARTRDDQCERWLQCRLHCWVVHMHVHEFSLCVNQFSYTKVHML